MVVRIQIFLNSSTSVSPMEMLPAYICTLLKNTIILYNNKVRHANSPTESCITLLLMNNVVQKKVSIPRGKDLEFYIRLFWMIISYKRELTPKICKKRSGWKSREEFSKAPLLGKNLLVKQTLQGSRRAQREEKQNKTKNPDSWWVTGDAMLIRKISTVVSVSPMRCLGLK